jgi:WD40 repeat protein
LASGDTILLRDIATGNPRGAPIQVSNRVTGFQVTQEEKLLVWTNQEVQIWDLSTRQRLGEALKIGKQLIPMDVSANARRMLLGRIDFAVEAWDVPTANRRLALTWVRNVTGVSLDRSGTSLTYSSTDHTLNRCDLSRSDGEHTWLDAASVAALNVSADTPTPRYFARFSDRDQTLLEVVDNNSLSRVGPLAHLNAPATVAVCSPWHDLILTGCQDGSAQLWSPPTMAPVGVVIRHSEAVSSGAFSPDGRTVATASGRTARLWDVFFCRPIGPAMEHPENITGVYFSTDGRWLFVTCDAKGGYRWPVPVPMEGDTDGVLDRVKELTR